MRKGIVAAAAVLGLSACAELLGPRGYRLNLTIVPVFDAADPSVAAAAAAADQLRIRVLGADSTGAFTVTVVDTVVAIDPQTGQAEASLSIPLVRSPQTFRLVLTAVRSSDGTILFSGTSSIQVSSSTGGTTVSTDTIPLPYVGPRAVKLKLAPKDTAVTGTGSFTYRVTALDSAGRVVSPQPQFTFFLVNPADSTKLRLGKFTGTATPVAGATGTVQVRAEAPGPTAGTVVADTARVTVGTVPAAVVVTPGYLNIGVGDTVTLNGNVLDITGTPILSSAVTWVSRAPSVARVSASGTVTGVAPGTVVVVASGSGFADSTLITVVTASHAVVSSTSSGRGFRAARVGDTVVVDLTVDARFTPNEKAGSYQAGLDWNAAVLAFIDVQSTGFAAPTVNPGGGGCTHQLCLAAADPQNASANVVVARVRLRALAQGSTSPALTITELSSNVPPTYTNLLAANRVTVTSGSITVRP